MDSFDEISPNPGSFSSYLENSNFYEFLKFDPSLKCTPPGKLNEDELQALTGADAADIRPNSTRG